MNRVSVLLITTVACSLVVLSSCGKRQTTSPAPEPRPECRVLDAPRANAGSVTFALPEPVDLRHAPSAANASERTVFGHLYETLITIDCAGDARPGVAESWVIGEGGVRWTFDIRGSARFWDGTPVTARDVVASWQGALALDTVIDSASAASDRRLHVYLHRPCPQVPRFLSASVYAVTKTAGDSRWPMGSGPYRIGSVDVTAFPTSRRTISVYPAFGGPGPAIRFVETSADGARDGLQGAIDAMVTSDPVVIEYATGRPQFVTVALPWDRTYAVLSTSRVQELGKGRVFAAIPSDILDGLARDAVRGAARGYRSPSWWDELSECGEAHIAGSGDDVARSAVSSWSSPRKERRIIYDAGDPVARSLAERIVALAAADTARSPEAKFIAAAVPELSIQGLETIAVGLTPGEFEESLHRGGEFAYVVSVTRQPPDPCDEARKLIDRAPWLAATGHHLPDIFIPLVDTRSHLIAGKETVEVTVDGYGSVLVALEGQEKR